MSNRRDLTLVQMNDSHGYIAPHPELFWHGRHPTFRKVGGFARVAGALEAIRRERSGKVLAFDCGDTVHGTYPAVSTEGQALIPLLNQIGFDAMTAHWEFAYGPKRFQTIARQLNYPVLAINCYDDATGERVFDPYIIREANGIRVGIIGIAATIVDKVMPPHFSEGLHFTLGNRELPGFVTELREKEKVDLVIVLSHLGFPQEVKLAREVSGIDVLLSGHTHNRLFRPIRINNTIIIQSGCHASFLGRLDVSVESGRVADYRHHLIVLGDSVQPNEDVAESVKETLAPERERLGEVVGYTETDLHRYTALEATMDNLLLDALVKTTGATIAFSNGWRYGAPIPAGPITQNDLYNIIPVNPPVSTCQLTGDELWHMMEENLERTFSADPYQQMGGFVKRCAGLNLYFKLENPAGQRIQELFVGGKRVRPDAVYNAAFVTRQGVPAKYGSDRREHPMRAIDALTHYLGNTGGKPVSAALRNTVVAV